MIGPFTAIPSICNQRSLHKPSKGIFTNFLFRFSKKVTKIMRYMINSITALTKTEKANL